MNQTKWKLTGILLALVCCLSACGSPSPSPSQSPDHEETKPLSPPPAMEETETPVQKNPIDELLQSMTIEEKVGQMFFARCPETDGAAFAKEYKLGGYILFGRDFKDKTPEQVKEAIASYQAAASIPMLIGVDEEGGTVTRVSRYPAFRENPFLSPRQVYQAGGLDGLVADTQEKAQLLLGLGINVNLAPVCDLSDNPDDFIYQRSLGGDPETVSTCVSTMVRTMREAGIGSTLKHFPGYGDNEDTHTGIAYDKRAYDTFLTRDFIPFQAAMEAGADSVLVAHNIVDCMDPNLPASLSPEVHHILREELGFDGVVITDDLAMDAIGQFTDGKSAAVLAVQAGNDLLCCSNVEEQLPAVLEAVRSGLISEEQIDASVRRVLQWKMDLGLLELEK